MLFGLFPAGLWKLCAHNGREFDFPYVARRMLIKEVRLPDMLDTICKKTMGNPPTWILWNYGNSEILRITLPSTCFVLVFRNSYTER